MINKIVSKNVGLARFHTNVLMAALALFISACTTLPDQTAKRPGTMHGESNHAEPTTAAGQDVPNKSAPERPKIELTEEILYKLLVAEIAGQRDQLNLAVENYLDLARSTRDPHIVSRATRIAVYARDDSSAREAAHLWAELDPENSDARQVLAVMAVREGNTTKALEHLEVILKSDGQGAALSQKLLMVTNFLSREKDKEQVKSILEELMVGYQDDPEILFAYAQVLTRMAELSKAREVLEQVLALVPENNDAAMTYVSVLNQLGREGEALAWLESALKENKDDFTLRIFYARILTDLQRFDEARRQFEILIVQDPVNADVLFSLGLLYLQSSRLDDAENYFVRLLEMKGHVDDASYYLGRITEEKDDLKKAGDWYRGVSSGKNYFDAKMRIGVLLGKQNKFEEARSHLSKIQTQSDRERSVLIQAEAEMLIEAERFQDAMDVYDKALQGNYDEDLLYSRAMLAEKIGRLDILEKDLRVILDKDPNNSQALNALGYTLADRTDRYDEAYDLIKKALEISPNDYFILDSMGWILYRQGRLDESIEFLNKALSEKNDPEIAAHLGEVLWIKGDKEAAQAIWDTALKESPDDDGLRKVINRLNP
jgi:tetratricopeptide (TPR) repeat protein